MAEAAPLTHRRQKSMEKVFVFLAADSVIVIVMLVGITIQWFFDR
jgi:hypothetical protein